MTQRKKLVEISWQSGTPACMVGIIEKMGTEVFIKEFADSPRLLAYLEANFSGGESAEHRSQLLEAADESPFSLRQWVESLHTLQSWLDARGLDMPVADQLGYVCCAGDSAGSGANLTHLPALVAEMLEAYGCERAVKVGGSG